MLGEMFSDHKWLMCRRNQLFCAKFSGCFLLTASMRWQGNRTRIFFV
jgi:hypothetical protein